LQENFDPDWNKKTLYGMTPLHYAAQRIKGIVSIYFLKEHNESFNPNVTDKYNAPPLHYGILKLQEFNI